MSIRASSYAKVLFIFLCLIVFDKFVYYSGQDKKNRISEDKRDIVSIDLSQKDLDKLFFGNDYYKYHGIRSRYGDSNSKVTQMHGNMVLRIDTDTLMYNEYIINPFNVSIDSHPHDGLTFSTQPKHIYFNRFNSGYFNFTPAINKILIEKNNQRFSYTYRLGADDRLYLDEGISDVTITNLKNIVVYEKSYDVFTSLRKKGIVPISHNAFVFVHNPLTNIYSLYPDLKYFAWKVGNYYKLPDGINLSRSNNKAISDTIRLGQSTSTESDMYYANQVILVSPGAEINMYNESNLYFDNCEINFVGHSGEPILIQGHGVNGMYFSGCNNIIFRNVEVFGMSAINNDIYQLPSAVTFYKSNVVIDNCEFSRNVEGDDFLNLFSSNFTITNSNFSRTIADAIDSDFSEGLIDSCTFDSIGNDGIDFSGSSVNISNSKFTNILDKAISVGENSHVTIQACIVSNNEIGMVAKDGSTMVINEVLIDSNRLDIVAFIKKRFYSNPTMEMDSSILKYKYLIQEGSNIHAEGRDSIIYVTEVEQMLYGNTYGKSSK